MRKVVTSAIASAALLGAAIVAPVAQAAPCDGVGMQQPFLDWHDSASYVLVDGGDFESPAADWTLEGGAATTAGGNPFRPDSSATALSLPAGSTATSPPICVAKGNPTARLFARSLDASKARQPGLRAEVLYLNDDGDVRKVKKAGKLSPRAEWGPTRKFSLAQGQFNANAKPDGVHGPPADPGNGNGGGNGQGGGPPDESQAEDAGEAEATGARPTETATATATPTPAATAGHGNAGGNETETATATPAATATVAATVSPVVKARAAGRSRAPISRCGSPRGAPGR